MAVFIDYSKKIVVITSYKVGYSTLMAQQSQSFKYLHYEVNRDIFKHLVKNFHFKRYCIVRHPYERFASLFSDKYRKQPRRILEKLHTWENVHKCLYPYLQISTNDTDEVIASKFLEMQHSDFLKILPKVIDEDAHFTPQNSSRAYNLWNQFSLKLPIHRYFRLEDQLDELVELTGLNFDVTANSSNSKNIQEILTKQDRKLLDNIYAKDFKLGNYK